MGFLDYIIPTSMRHHDQPSTVYKDLDQDQPNSAEEEIPSTPKKKKAPKMLRELQEQLTDNMLTPSTRKRSRNETPNYDLDSPTKKRVVTSSPVKQQDKKFVEPSFGILSPPTTPQKSVINKPILSLIRSGPQYSSPVKKLNFEEPSATTSFASPPTTPIKIESPNLASANLTKKKISFVSSPIKRESDLESNKENIEPSAQTPISPPFTPRKQSIYTKAKSVFHRSYRPRYTESLPERHLESQALKEFLIENITKRRSTSLYISGPPGTGKTAQINLSLSQFIDTEAYNAVRPVEIDGVDYKVGYTYINCMTVNNIKGIFSEIYSSLTGKKTSLREAKDQLLDLISNNSFSDMNIIVLDELDKLITEDQQVLFELFAWTILEKTNLMLIGISNALDMVDRLLPRLKTNGLNPNTLVFMPYTSDQIAGIIRSRLRLLNSDPTSDHIPLFHPTAIQLCSKKSASNSGDLRKALDICRNAIELVERGLKMNSCTNQDPTAKIDIFDYDEFSAPQVKISHVAKVCSNVFNQNQVMKLQALNLQQKIMLCMLVKAEEDNPFKFLDLNSFFEYYVNNSKSDTLIGVLKKGEFLEIVSNMESIGVLRKTIGNSNFSNARIASTVVKKDLTNMVKNIPVLEQLLSRSSTGLATDVIN